MAFEAVVKVGGSLLEVGALAPFAAACAGLARRHRILCVPGGGPFSDAVRAADRRWRLPAETAHRMAVLAMDQYGLLLASRAAGLVPVEDVGQALRVAEQGSLPVLLPARLILAADPLENSWRVTSDSLAAWIAGLTHAGVLVLAKVAGGVPRDRTAITPAAAAAAGSVDGAFPASLSAARRQWPGLGCWIVDGSRPAQLVALLDDGRSEGTEVRDASTQG